MIHLSEYESPLGTISIAGEDNSIIGLWFVGQKYFQRGLKGAVEVGECAGTRAATAWLDAYFAGEKPEAPMGLTPRGTEFQLRVWDALLRVPYGTTTTYGELARAVGCASARAVGSAVGRNPLLLMVPCHRVVGTNGSLTGYAAGVERKRALLELEGGVRVDGV